jgi:hypothetical protein
MTGTEYYQAIEQHLRNSRKLIVVCSPRARDSDYVNDEIRRFAAFRGAENIIPVIIDGLPNNEVSLNEQSKNAFPEALCEVLQIPLAVDYREFNPDRDKIQKGAHAGSWYMLLSNLYGVSRSEIEQRDRRRQLRQRNITIVIVSGVIATLATLAGIAWWQRGEAIRQSEIAMKNLDDALLGYAGLAHIELGSGDLYCADYDLRYMLRLAKPLPVDASFALLWATFADYFARLGDGYVKKAEFSRADESYQIAMRILDHLLQTAATRADDIEWKRFFTLYSDERNMRWPGLLYVLMSPDGRPTVVTQWRIRLKELEDKRVNLPVTQQDKATGHRSHDDHRDLADLCDVKRRR